MRYHLCKVYGLTFRSSIPIPELGHANGEEPECTFQLLTSQRPGFATCHWFHHLYLPDGTLWLSRGRQGSDYLLRFPELADFLVSNDGKTIYCYSDPDTPMETIRHLLLDQVFPLVLSVKGSLVLHASAVVLPEGAIAFLGMTGWGKSTLTATFWQQGFPLLTDDCLLLQEEGGRLLGIPAYPGVRLWPETISAFFGPEPTLTQVAHYTTKKRLVLDHGRPLFCTDAVPLSRVYILAPPEETENTKTVTIAALPARDAFAGLLNYVFRLDITDRQRLQEEFNRLSRVVTLTRFCSLTFPRDLARLPAVREAILAHLT